MVLAREVVSRLNTRSLTMTTSTDTATPAKVATPFTMPAVSLMDSYEPVVRSGVHGRVAAPNPFIETVDALAKTWDDTLKRSKAGARLTYVTGERDILKARFGKAANAAGFSPAYDDKAEEKGKSVLVAYLVPKITRIRKVAETTPEATPAA